MSATKPPDKDTLLGLLEIMRTAERPLLMHCKSGADRTGLAAAIFVLDNGKNMAAARGQLSARFLHFRRGRKAVLDRFLDLYERALAENDVTIEQWIRDAYEPADLVEPNPADRR
jgi:protein tyrosine/serine phosphatase